MEAVIRLVMEVNPNAVMVIKSTIPVGYTVSVREKFGSRNILFRPEFLRESKALYDNLYPSRIIVGTDPEDAHLVAAAHEFAALLQGGLSRRTLIPSSWALPRPRLSSCSPTLIWRCVCAYFNELDTYAESKGLNTKQIIDGVCLDRASAAITITPASATAATACPKDRKQLLANYADVPENLIEGHCGVQPHP